MKNTSKNMGPMRPNFPFSSVPPTPQRPISEWVKPVDKDATNNEQRPFNSHHTNTMQIVDFLYPQNQGKRFPLTRCLLSCMIENVYVNYHKDEQNFRTIINVLLDLLEDMNVEGTLSLAVLSDFLEIEELDDWALMSYEMFFNYSKIESQKYTVACLLYDLIPLINVSFDKITNAIRNNHTLQAFLSYQAKGAVYDNDRALTAIFQARAIADKYFATSETVKKGVIQVAIFMTADAVNETCELDFDMIHLKNMLMDIVHLGPMVYNHKDIFNTDTTFSTIMQCYAAIANSSESVRDMAIMVLERILMVEGNISSLLPSPKNDASSRPTKRSKNSKAEEFDFF